MFTDCGLVHWPHVLTHNHRLRVVLGATRLRSLSFDLSYLRSCKALRAFSHSPVDAFEVFEIGKIDRDSAAFARH
jgi:hypothetical protein